MNLKYDLSGNSPRRFLICAGVEKYAAMSGTDLESVPHDLDLITAWFARNGFALALPCLRHDPTTNELRANLFDWFSNPERTADDEVVFYYTGHGETADRHYLLASNSRSDGLTATAIPADDLLRIMLEPCRLGRLLVILDTCYAGHGIADAGAVISRMRAIPAGAQVILVAAARAREAAIEGLFANALTAVLDSGDRRLGGRLQTHFPIDVVVGLVNEKLGGAQTVTWWPAPPPRGPIPGIIPNPRYVPPLPAEHWLVSAMGTETASGGWHFTGRGAVIESIVEWLSATESDGRARVVTGAAGTGKSAILARIVTLSDPEVLRRMKAADALRMTPDAAIPAVGAISVAVNASGRALRDVALLIARSMRLDDIAAELDAAATPDEVLAAVRQLVADVGSEHRGRVAIVLDSIDEAVAPGELLQRLLRPLIGYEHVRLLIGTRPEVVSVDRPRVPSLGTNTEVFDLDDPRWLGDTDIADYVESRLLCKAEPKERTPYRGRTELARQVAEAVARQARGVFLVARLVTRTLMDAGEAVDVSVPGWDKRFPSEAGKAFRDSLGRFDQRPIAGLNTAKVRDLLIPLAWTEGQGIPRILWPRLASRISNGLYTDGDVEAVMEHAAAYITETIEYERSVYRLYHQALVEHLRDAIQKTDIQTCITQALLSSVPADATSARRNWLHAHPYVRAYFPRHAAAAGLLDDFIEDPLFLAASEPSVIVPLLSSVRGTAARRACNAYRLVVHFFGTTDAGERLAYLELSARQMGIDSLAEAVESMPVRRPWSVPWAVWSQVHPHRVLVGHDGEVAAVAIIQIEGGPVIVSGGHDGTIRRWDFATGEPYGDPLAAHSGKVLALAPGDLRGRAVVVSGGEDGAIRCWDVATGHLLASPLSGHVGAVSAVAVAKLGGRTLVVSGGHDGTVRCCDVSTGENIGDPLEAHDGAVTAIAVAKLRKRVVIVSGGADAFVCRWDLASGALIGERLECGYDENVFALAIAELDGRAVIVSGGQDGTIRRFDLTSGRARRDIPSGHLYVSALPVAPGQLNGRPVVVSSWTDDTIRFWDVRTGKPTGAPLSGINDVVALATAVIAGREVVVSGSYEGTVRICDLGDADASRARVAGHEGTVRSIVAGRTRGEPVAVSAGDDGTIRRWDLATGKARGAPLNGHDGGVFTLAIVESKGRPILVSGGLDGTVRLWNLATGKELGRPLTDMKKRYYRGGVISERLRILAVAASDMDGKPVIVAGGDDAMIRRWDAVTFEPLGDPIMAHDGEITALCLGRIAGRSIAVSGSEDRTIRVWDVATGNALCSPLAGHEGVVQDLVFAEVDGRPLVVSGGDDKAILIWDLGGSEPDGRPLAGHTGAVTALATGQLDGRPVLVSAAGGAISVWDVRENRAIARARLGESTVALAVAEPMILAGTPQGILAIQFNLR